MWCWHFEIPLILSLLHILMK